MTTEENGKEEDVKLSEKEINKLLKLIKSGKTLKEIAKAIDPSSHKQKSEDKKIKVEVKSNEDSKVNIEITYKVDDTKLIKAGLTESLNGRNLFKAHEEIYLNVLSSIENLISLTK